MSLSVRRSHHFHRSSLGRIRRSWSIELFLLITSISEYPVSRLTIVPRRRLGNVDLIPGIAATLTVEEGLGSSCSVTLIAEKLMTKTL
jgi:hypothetical protein